MLGIIGVIASLTVLGLSLIVTRLATIAMVVTGLSEESAKFQTRSAFTGTGFTTGESEQAVNHPVRRRIIMLLMTIRSAGFITIIMTLILSVGGPEENTTRLWRLVALVAGVFLIWILSASRVVNRALSRLMERLLRRWTDLDIRDYASLLHLSGDYQVVEVGLEQGDWLIGKSVRDCALRDEGVTILGVHRPDGSYIGVPRPDTPLRAGDVLILYGRARALRDLDQRRAGTTGDKAHETAVSEENDRLQEQTVQEAAEEQRRRAEETARKAAEAEHRAAQSSGSADASPPSA